MTQSNDQSFVPGTSKALPEKPDLQNLKKQAKRLLKALRAHAPDTKLSDAQLQIARDYGFQSWRALKAHIDAINNQTDERKPQAPLTESQKTDATALIAAINQNDHSTIKRILKQNPDWIHRGFNDWEQTPLHTAAYRADLSTVTLLLDIGADPNLRCKGDNAYPIHFAAERGELDIVKLLAGHGNDIIGQGDVHQLDIIGWACCFDFYHKHVVEYLLENGGRHNVYSATACNNILALSALLDHDPSLVNRRLSQHDEAATPLHIAVKRQSNEAALLLLERGADASLKDRTDMTPLAHAAQGGYSGLIQILRPHTEVADISSQLWLADPVDAEQMLADLPEWLEEGGRLDKMLMGACYGASLEKIKHLIKLGARPDVAVDMGWGQGVTPMHIAASNDRKDIIEYLLSLGADPTVKDQTFESDVPGWADYFKKHELAQWLRHWMTDHTN